MLRNKLRFAQLEKDVVETGGSVLDYLAPDIGKVYVVAIARSGCPACERQKPELDRLEKKTAEKHGERVAFIQIHVKHPTEKDRESLRSKDILGHYFYPTNMILLRTKDRGTIEYYRNVSPRMSELRRNIEIAIEIARILEKDLT